MVIVVIWIICAFVCASVASGKHRSGVGWFFIGLILGVLGVILVLVVGDNRPPTIIVQQTAAPRPRDSDGEDGSIRSGTDKDRRRNDEQATATQLQIAPPLGEPRDPRELVSAVAALKMLAEAGAPGLDERAIEAILSYLEAESGGIDYTRKQAAQVTAWIRALPSGDEAIRNATRTLRATVAAPERFVDAMTLVAGIAPTDLQSRWIAALRRMIGA